MPKHEPVGYEVKEILDIFVLVARSRRYEQGAPLPLTTKDITDVVEIHRPHADRYLLDGVIFAIDDEILSKQRGKAK